MNSAIEPEEAGGESAGSIAPGTIPISMRVRVIYRIAPF
jgi:hypothetical protein